MPQLIIFLDENENKKIKQYMKEHTNCKSKHQAIKDIVNKTKI